MIRNKIFAIDFDGTIVKHAYPKIGEPIPHAIISIKTLQKTNKIILWTMRSGVELIEAVNYCEVNGIKLFGINRNPEQTWSKSPKAYAHFYIDDMAIGCPLRRPKNEKSYVDWIAVMRYLGYDNGL